MSSSNASAAEVNAIKYATLTLIHVWSYVLFSLGTVGHVLNIYVFTRPKLRSNPCARYFLASAISGLFVTYTNVLLRLLQLVYNIDVFAYSLASCKILIYITFWARTQTSWLIALACVDRFLCSSRSTTVRAWSNIRIAFRITVLTTLIAGLLYIYIPIQYKTVAVGRFKCPSNQSNPPGLHGILSFIIYSTGPTIIMLIFGSLTIRHVQQRPSNRVAPLNIKVDTQNQTQIKPLQEQLQRHKTTDRQLIRMMLVQCIYFSLLSIPLSINWIYTSMRSNVVVDDIQSAKDDMFVQICGYLSLTCACTSFYFFTLSSKLFRHELMHLFSRKKQQHREINMNELGLT